MVSATYLFYNADFGKVIPFFPIVGNILYLGQFVFGLLNTYLKILKDRHVCFSSSTWTLLEISTT